MTKGNLSGNGCLILETRFRREKSRSRQRLAISRTFAVSLAVWAAIHSVGQAAQGADYPTPQIVPIDSGETYEMPGQDAAFGPTNAEEPLPPGEGPDGNNIDTVVIGGSSSKDFWKPEVHFGATVGAVFQDNLFITHENTVSDLIYVASARVTLAFGNVQQWASRFIDTSSRTLNAEISDDTPFENLFALTYAPTANFFQKNDQLNTVDEDVALTARWTFTKLHLALDGRLQTLSDPDEDLGRRADRTITTAVFLGTYDWSEKTKFELNSRLQNRDYDVGTDSLEINGSAFILYQLMPKTSIGFGLGGGELELSGGDTQTYEQGLLRLKYNSFSKIAFTATAGGEIRQGVSGEDQTNGVFELGMTYDPANDTEISLTAFRRTDASATGDSESIERTSFTLSVSQRLFQKLSLSASVDYSIADYANNSNSRDSGRTDDLLGISATLTFEVTQNGFARLGYLYRQDDSSLIRNTYEANQVVLSFTVLF